MSGSSGVTDIDIEGLKRFQGDKSATIVDVRNVDEIKETGPLPGSINIPLGNLKTALEESNERFQENYCIAKPETDKPIVFSCRSGKRSLTASQTALSLGYNKVFNYAGGWLDWEKHQGK